jgi:large subunit ribosomal protein L24
MKLKKGDTIKVLIGKDKGKTGRVERLNPEKDMVLIENINQFKRHVKSKAQNQKSEIVTITKPLHAGNVAIICPSCKKTTRIGYQIDKAGKKVRICRKCGKEIK